MMRLPDFFRRTPDPRAETFAEALALYEEGQEIAAILDRYPEEEREWLRPLLATGRIIGGAFEAEEASYYFEGALKAKVLAAAEPVIGGAPEAALPAPPRFGQLGAALASLAVLVVAGMLGVITFGFVTAGDSVPGEWNYGFKRATEQAQVRFARGDERINVHIRQAQERIDEIQTLAARGDLSQGHITSFTDEIEDIAELAEEEEFDSLQQAKVRSLSETAEVVLSETEEELAPAAAEAIDQAQQVAAAVSGGSATPVEEKPKDGAPTATPEPAAADDPAATPEPAASTPEPSPTPAAAADATPDASVSTGEDGDPQPIDDPTPDASVSTGDEGDPEPLEPSEPTEPDEPEEPRESPTATPEPTETPTPTATPEGDGSP